MMDVEVVENVLVAAGIFVLLFQTVILAAILYKLK